jgi:ribosomal-protein-alanine N-acetyltransferase
MTDVDDIPPILRTERLVLRAPDEADIPAWYMRATDREAASLAGDSIPESIDAGADWLARSRHRAKSGNRLQWSVDCPAIAKSVGTVSLSIKDRELSFVFGRAYWGQGLASEAAHEVLRYAFGPLDLPNVKAEVAARNLPSLRVLVKLGFEKTGEFVDEADDELCEAHLVMASRFLGRCNVSTEDI